MINPARIVRELDEKYRKFYGIAGRVISFNPLKKENSPDDWERMALATSINGEPF